MKIFRGLAPERERCDCAVAIGNFDGVHKGHAALLRACAEAAKERGLVPAVLTFEPHPQEFFSRHPVKRVATLRDKIIAIRECGIERVHVMPFNAQTASLTPEEFAGKILSEGLSCRWVGVGENFNFGAKKAGNFATLKNLGQRYGFEAYCAAIVSTDGDRVSSSRIRERMTAGDIEEVSRLLGRPFSVTGRVVHGKALGRNLGFRTLNQYALGANRLSEPAMRGVYAVRIHGLDDSGDPKNGVAVIGCKPTVTTEKRWLVETHVFDWSGDVYGKMIRTEFIQKIRDEKKFSSLEELTSAIASDAAAARLIHGI